MSKKKLSRYERRKLRRRLYKGLTDSPRRGFKFVKK